MHPITTEVRENDWIGASITIGQNIVVHIDHNCRLYARVSCLSKFYPKNEKLQWYKNEMNRNEINKNYTVRSVVLYNNLKDKRIIL